MRTLKERILMKTINDALPRLCLYKTLARDMQHLTTNEACACNIT